MSSSIDARLQRLEAALGPHDPIRILVLRLPPEAMALDGAEQDEYVRAHPECISKVVEVPARGGHE